MILIKRVLSNIIDLLLLIIIVVLLFVFTKLDTNETNFSFIYFLAYSIIIFLPLALIGTTLGKKTVKLNWLAQEGIQLRDD